MLRTIIATLPLLAATLAAAQHDPNTTQAMHAAMGPTVTVTGEGTAAGEPDRVRIAFGVMNEADTADAAQARTSATAQKIIEAVRALNLPGAVIQTQGVSLNPVYTSRGGDGSPRVTGFNASNTVTVRFDAVDRAGEAIDTAVKAGANQVNSLSLEIRDEQPLRREALGQAVGTARGKAEAIAGALNMGLGDLVEIREQGAPGPIFPRMEGMMMRASADMATPVEGGEITLRASVVATYRLTER